MSDDLPPPDLTKTADVPLDGLLPFSAEAGEVPADTDAVLEAPLFEAEPPAAERGTLFSDARSVRLSSSEFVVDNPILEDEARPTSGPLPPTDGQAEPLGALRALWEESHDRGVPFYRRQGPLAGIGLLALLIIGAVSFPWTRATIESGVVILIDDSDESAAVGAGSANREELVESPASGTMVMGTKSTSASGSAEGFQSTSSQIASTSGVTASAPVTNSRAGSAAATTPPGPISSETTATTAIVAPVQLSCEDPAAVPPGCVTTEAPVTTIPSTPPVTEEPVTTTEPEPDPETTVKRTTTTEEEVTTTTEDEEVTTTTEKPTTTKPKPTTTTTEPDDDTTTTTEPDKDDTTTTTEPDEDDTTTTTEPDEDDTTTTTEPDEDTVPDTTEPPIDSGGSLPTAVNCTPTTQTGPSIDVPPRNIC